MAVLSYQAVPHVVGLLTFLGVPIPLPQTSNVTGDSAHTTDPPLTPPTTVQVTNQCEQLTIPICNGVGYNSTLFPNGLGMASQQAAEFEVHQFYPLIKIQCSDVIQFFLCSVYAPRCEPHAPVLPPCRHVCDSAKAGCGPLMTKFGFDWPDRLKCTNFPQDRPCAEPA